MWAALIVLVAAILVASAPLPQLDADTYLYAKIASRVAGGDWMILREQGWLIDKPPLQFWLMGGSFAAFGVSNVTIRAWHIAVAMLLLAATVLLGREAGLRADDAILGGLVLATSTQFLYQTIVPQDDIPMTAFVTLAVAGALRWRRTGLLSAALVCGGSLALAVLTKGIAACAVFALAVGAIATMWRSPPRAVEHTSQSTGTATPPLVTVLAAVLVFAAIAVPWFAAGVLREGAEFVHTFFTGGTLGVGRYFRPATTIPPAYVVSVFAYVPLLFVGMLPWSPVLVAGIVSWRRRGADPHGANLGGTDEGLTNPPSGVRVVGLWAAAVFVVLSLSASDRVFRYLLPCLPPVAVCVAWTLRRLAADRRLRGIAGGVALLPGVAAFAAGLWWLWTQFPLSRDLLGRVVVPVIAVLAVGLMLFGLALLRGRTRPAIVSAALAASIGWAIFEWGLGVHTRIVDPWPEVARIAARSTESAGDRTSRRRPVDVMLIGAATEGRHALALYLGAEPVTIDAVDIAAAEWRRRPLMVVVPAHRLAEINAVLMPAAARTYRGLGRVAVLLNPAALPPPP